MTKATLLKYEKIFASKGDEKNLAKVRNALKSYPAESKAK